MLVFVIWNWNIQIAMWTADEQLAVGRPDGGNAFVVAVERFSDVVLCALSNIVGARFHKSCFNP